MDVPSGKRPIDLHLYALKEMGTQIRETDGELYARTEGLKGSEILFSYPSVGATEQAVLAAVRGRWSHPASRALPGSRRLGICAGC